MGLELLEPEDEGKLHEIESNHPQNNGECCKKLFQFWLQKYPDATWIQMTQALRVVGLNQLASKIDGMLQSTEGIMICDL